MNELEVYERKDYLHYFYLQEILKDFNYFYVLNKKNECIRKYLIKKTKTKEFKKLNLKYDFAETHHFDTIEKFFQFCTESKIFITLYMDGYEISGIVNDFSDSLILIDTFEFTTEQNGVSLIPLSDVDEIGWDGMHEKKLEKFSTYNGTKYKITDFLNICSNGLELCQIFRQQNINMFLVGLSKKLKENYFLIQTIDLLGNNNGYVFLHEQLVDYFCFKTKYLNLYFPLINQNGWSTRASFFEYLKESKEEFYLIDYNGTDYYDITLIDFNDKYILFTQNDKKHRLLIDSIDVIDTRK